ETGGGRKGAGGGSEGVPGARFVDAQAQAGDAIHRVEGCIAAEAGAGGILPQVDSHRAVETGGEVARTVLGGNGEREGDAGLDPGGYASSNATATVGASGWLTSDSAGGGRNTSWLPAAGMTLNAAVNGGVIPGAETVSA